MKNSNNSEKVIGKYELSPVAIFGLFLSRIWKELFLDSGENGTEVIKSKNLNELRIAVKFCSGLNILCASIIIVLSFALFSLVAICIVPKNDSIMSSHVPAFKPDNITKICLQILEKWELQLSEKGRQTQFESIYKEICNIIAGLCTNPDTKQPYPVSIIEKGLKDVQFSVKQGKCLKVQGVELLKSVMSIQRAQMRVRVSATSVQGKRLLDKISALGTIEQKDFNDSSLNIVIVMDPGNYRELDELIRDETKGKGLIEVLNLKEIKEEEGTVE